MPVRLRITFLFSILAFVILSIVCGSIYYFSYQQRIQTIKDRLTNRAITTARLLSQREIFNKELVQRIDSSTTLSLKNKVVQAYDNRDRRIYTYSDRTSDSLNVSQELLDKTRGTGRYYFASGNKEVVAYAYSDGNARLVVITAGEDVDGKNNLTSLLRILVLSFLVGNIFVLVSGYIFSARLLRPIKKISEDVAEISAQNLTRRIHTGAARDEWYQLSHTLNELLNRLQESFELQSRFISNASHELSTPLTSISSQLEVALQRDRGATEYQAIMHSIYQDVQHLIKLTQTLLEFAKASGNSGGLEINLVRLDEIVLGLPAEVVKINPVFGVQIHFEDLPEDEEKLFVFGNEALLLTAIKNIVINACKYSQDHRAHVSLKVQESELLVVVRNQGEGIPQEELENIFQPFYRIEETRTATGGFGLGLSLATRIVQLHRGSIRVSSQPGGHTNFTIHLPSAQSLQPL